MPIVTLEPNHTEIDVPDGTPIRDAIAQAGLRISSVCGGTASCGLCRVKVLEGEENLTPQVPEEVLKLGNVYFITKERLACQAKVKGGPSRIMLPEEDLSRSRSERKRKWALERNMEKVRAARVASEEESANGSRRGRRR